MPGCGGCGKRTRREFLQTAAAGAAVLALSSVADAASSPTCADIYDSCCRNCELEVYPLDKLCKLACKAEQVLCEIQELLHRLGKAFEEGMQFLVDHPWIPIGTLLLFGGITFLVVAGAGGGLVLAML
jgi:hypothetical protein